MHLEGTSSPTFRRLPPSFPSLSAGGWAALAMGGCALWWLYLASSSSMVLRFDAAEYHTLGALLHRQGWRAFLATGPHREPLYPLLVALAMRLGEQLATSSQKVLAALQLALVASAQLLMLRLARLMGLGTGLAVAVIAYFGVSPAVVNSACSMFSEVLSYPFVLLATLLTAEGWQAAEEGNARHTAVIAAAAAFAFACGAFVKGVLHYVCLLVVVLFGVRAVLAWRRRRRDAAVAALVFALVNLLLGLGAVHSYRELNRRYNGNYEFTSRYVGLLYGNAAKRAMPFTPRQHLAHLAAIPGDGVCRMFFSEEECNFCAFGAAEALWLGELPSHLEGVPISEQRAATLRLFRAKVMERPAQYAFVGLTQVLRMPFWESTQLGYVAYPAWLEGVYAKGIVKNGLRLLVGLLTFAALAWAGARLVRPAASRGGRALAPPCATVLFVAVSFMLLHAPFSTLTRYALPIAPLYLLLIAAMLDDRLARYRRPVTDPRPLTPLP